MTTLFDRLKKHFPFLGERAVTEADLFEICERRGVEVVFAHEIRAGIYVHRAGRDHIFLNAMLHGQSLVYVLSHEIAHMLLHVPTRSRGVALGFNGETCSRRNHAEAETAAALLMFPLTGIDRRLFDAANSGFTDMRYAELIMRRLMYYHENKV